MHIIEETNECVLLDKDMNLLYPEYPSWDVEEDEEKTINENS
jgi:hypothetical protein